MHPHETIETPVLNGIHMLLTQILGELDRICNALGITYAAYGGTAIGAVRHGGFIPWDDDADVLMPRADYERFLAEAPKLLGKQYALHNTRTVANFPFMFTKMVLKDTLLIPEFAKNCSYRMPIFVDILPVDNIPDEEGAFHAMSRRSWWWGRLLFLRGTPRPYLIGITGIRRHMIYALTTLAHIGMKITHITPRFLQARWERAVRRYEKEKTNRMADFTMRDPEKWILTHEELLPTCRVSFSGITIQLPHQYDVLLRRGYGDYMELPPPEQRRNHKPFLVDFGPYADTVTNSILSDPESV